jgi:hypothetical protein
MVADIAAAVGRLEAPAVEQVGHHAAPVRVIGLLGQCTYKTASVNNQNKNSVADPGCLSRIPDPNFYHPGSEFFPSRIRIFFITDPGSASKDLSILTQKIVSKLSEI